ncbi:hypothetical protein Psi02_04420 [Planotetraspora silvatica]|uniref:Uncharacterized protein n=1 Tax=Planotetraspora silvatica TaxID=234614 RepID=A0A8J3UEY9_9ACTN|nr:hypothetical protein [Planotetraspora silvatica]GII44018.1 hypothetical protein Psi02_04420 [Planotetraspora silvatica]
MRFILPVPKLFDQQLLGRLSDAAGMIVDMSTDWLHLEHAYGAATDVPRLFEEAADPELAVEAWDELWSCLCHQGTVYPASFAALPVLADIATGRRPGDSRRAISLASRIVVGEEHLHQPGYCREHYPAAIEDLRRMTQHYMTAEPFDGSERDYLYPLEDLLAFEGVPVWSHCLLPDLHDAICPSCSECLEIDFYHAPPGTRRRDPHESLRKLNFKGPTLTGVRPAAPADLQQPASRLYRLAVNAGQSAAAEHLTYLFGRATCPSCAADFSVPEQIEACNS